MEEKDLIYHGKIAIGKVMNYFKKNKPADKPQPESGNTPDSGQNTAPDEVPIAQPQPQEAINAEPAQATGEEPVQVSGGQPQSQQQQSHVGEQPQNPPAPATAPVTADKFNYVNFIEDIRPKILSKIEDNYPKLKTYSDYTLLIYINDKDVYHAAKINEMANVIEIYIDSRRGKKFKNIQVHTGDVNPGYDWAIVDKRVVIALGKDTVAPQQQKVASISLMYDNTSACTIGDGHIILDPQENTVWNIGWGKDTLINNRPRTNHIAFRYKNPEEQNTNVYMVSRGHAHIKFTDGQFFLYVEERGTRQAGKRTKIERDGKEVELTNTEVGFCLKDRDKIRLNAEYLLFTYK